MSASHVPTLYTFPFPFSTSHCASPCGPLSPFKDGTNDDTFHALFKPIMRRIMEVFQPGAIVMQCGEGTAGGELDGQRDGASS